MKCDNGKIGILGAGQLASMLCEAAGPLSLSAQSFNQALTNVDALKAFLSSCAVVTFENEFVDCALLESLASGRDLFRPHLSVLRVLQNKLFQKQMMKRLHIPTSHFVEISCEAAELYNVVSSQLGERFVLKWAQFGYDGGGVLVVDSTTPIARIEDFIQKSKAKSTKIYGECFVPFSVEAAMIAVRSSQDFLTYPLVLSEQRDGICYLVRGPASALGYSLSLQQKAKEICATIATHLNILGTFAVEFFVTDSFGLLVNEIAPRVHNSGHYTQNAGGPSQFENHWRALLGHPLSVGSLQPFFGMLNILGPQGLRIDSPPPPHSTHENLKVHWYNKDQMRPRRKMGHINFVAQTREDLQRAVEHAQSCLAKWEQQLKGVE